jgi:hypothetical protein
VSLRLASRTASSEYAGDGHAGRTVALGAVYPSPVTRAFAARTAASTAGAIANVDCPPFCVATATTDDAAETTGRPASARLMVSAGRALPSSPAFAAPRFGAEPAPNARSESPPLTVESPPTDSTR